MSKKRYTEEFRQQAVSLVREGKRPASEIAKELDIKTNTLYTWLQKSNKASSSGSCSPDLLAENKRLKKELAQSNLEKEILKKAAAYFAKETL